MQFLSLGSGSRGNATLVRSGSTTLMIDCGFSIKETCKRLATVETGPEDIDAIIVTHEHGDHVRGVGPFSRRHELPVWMSRGTAQFFKGEIINAQQINVHQSFQIGDILIEPVPVPHDAREPCQFVFSTNNKRLGLLTDVGSITPHIVQSYADCDAMLLEFNHDSDMLAGSDYPASVRNRIASDLGHLSNSQSCGLLEKLLPGSLRFVVAAHLSESNNSRDKVRSQLKAMVNGSNCHFEVAAQDKVSGWYSLDEYVD